MATRLSRSEQVERNAGLVLEAARRVFLARGYAGASLDAIAEEAGFSKGVVYSQFESKGDLFLTLLERRIDERAEQNEAVAAASAGRAGVAALLELAQRLFQQEPGWSLLVLEFRVHAAREPRLRRRYAEAHARTVERLGRTLARVHERAGIEPALPTRVMAAFILALGAGVELERLNDPEALPMSALDRMIPRALGFDGNGRGRAIAAAPRAARKERR
jgi:AcrR family transcriptional regulator